MRLRKTSTPKNKTGRAVQHRANTTRAVITVPVDMAAAAAVGAEVEEGAAGEGSLPFNCGDGPGELNKAARELTIFAFLACTKG